MSNKDFPKHVAIIMDGNGRWAQNQGKPRLFGHRAGAKTVRRILTEAGELGIKYLTLYAFSTENWKRSKLEVNGLMKLFSQYLRDEKDELMKKNVRLKILGRRIGVDSSLLKAIDETVYYLKDNTGITLNLAFNYGGRAEIVDSVNALIKSGKSEITEEDIKANLYGGIEIPDPDLIIRTSGEFRTSNFLVWQSAYSEFYITETYWPDFSEEEFRETINQFMKRDRRFGGVKNVK